MTAPDRPYASFFGTVDEDISRVYIERSFGAGSFVALDPGASDRDEILMAGLLSARDYMMQSAGCRNVGGTDFRVFPAIVDTIRPNAFATFDRDLHLCAMNSGMYGSIFELCLFVMAQPSVFAEIGDPAMENGTSLPESTIPGFWMIDQLSVHAAIIDRALAPTLVPKCPQRYDFAVILTLHMMRFVWFHELFHCLNGHVGALCELVPSIRLHELPDPAAAITLIELEQVPLPLAASDYCHAIELDADRSALWGAFRT